MAETAPQYSYSTDEETYQQSFDTFEEACKEAAASVGLAGVFWVGRQTDPTQPEDWWEADNWLEHVSCQDEYSHECAADWDESTEAQREELETAVKKVLAAWLDRHDLRPKFFLVDDVKCFIVTGDNEKTGEFKFEEYKEKKHA